METNQEYFVFISYSSLDNDWAIWLRDELEHYHLPASFNGRTDVRDNLRKVFRDRDELSAGPEWDEQVNRALANTNNLIVICSPNAAKSDPVNKEVETFIALGKEDHIFPFIVEGNDPKEYFPKSLKTAKVGGDVNKDGGSNAAFIKVVSGMLKVGFPSLWERYEREKAEEERKIREQRDNLLRVQSRFLAEKANALVEEGDSYTARLLALEALPKDLENPDRPYVPEVEAALIKAYEDDSAILFGHTDDIESLLLTQEERLIVSISFDNTIRLWDLTSGREQSQIVLPKGNRIFSTIISSNGNELLYASEDKSVHVWNIHEEREVRHYNWDWNIVGGNLHSAILSPNGKYIAFVPQYNNLPIIWDVELGKVLYQFPDHISSPTFNQDNSYFAFSTSEFIVLWDIQSEREKCRFKVNEFSKILFRPNTNHILTYSSEPCADKSIKLWDIDSGKIICSLMGHSNIISGVSFSPDGKFIVSASYDNTIRVWDVENCNEFYKIEGVKTTVKAIALTNNVEYVISNYSDNTIRIWNMQNKKTYSPIYGHGIDTITSLAFSSDSKKIVTGSKFSGSFTDQELELAENGYLDFDTSVTVWDLEHRKIIKKLPCLFQGYLPFDIDSVDINYRGNILASVPPLKIWSLETGRVISFDNIGSSFVKYSPDGQNLMTKQVDDIIILDIHTWKIIQRMKGHKDLVTCADYSYDGFRIVSGSDDKTVRVWSVNQGVELNTFKGHGGSITSVDFSPNGLQIVSASYDHTIRIWDIVQKKEICILKGHSDIVNCASFNLKGDKILSASRDGTVRIWDIESEKEIRRIKMNDYRNNAAFSPDNKYIAITSNNDVFLFNNYNLQNLINENRERFKNRQFTPEERKKYYLD